MAAMGGGDRAGAGSVGTAAHLTTTTFSRSRPDMQETLMYMQLYGHGEKPVMGNGHHKNKASVHLPHREAEGGWGNLAAPPQTTAPTMPICSVSATREASYSFRSPESVEMDEIMAAMVLTSLSCSPVVQPPPHADGSPAGSSAADMECGGEELSDSGSSGYWSWDHGNVSPAPSSSVAEMDSSPDEGLQMELEQGEELNGEKPKTQSSFRGVYRCLWPSCGKVLTSSVGMKRHVRVLHLGIGAEQSQREEDFYYTKLSCEPVEAASQQGAASPPRLCWAPCTSPAGSGLRTPPPPSPGPSPSASPTTPLSQSAPSSFWQIHSEHLYQACNPVQVSVAPRNPSSQGWTPFPSGHNNTPMVKPRFRSLSVGEQWLQQNSATNRLQTMSVSPSRTLCSFRKGRGEAKKCRKVYGVERKDEWCTACRWKKACQRFPD